MILKIAYPKYTVFQSFELIGAVTLFLGISPNIYMCLLFVTRGTIVNFHVTKMRLSS